MARFTIGSGSVQLNVDDPLRDVAIRAAREAAPRTFAILESYADKLVADARAKWPVGRARKGVRDGEGRAHSRDLLEAQIVVETNGTVRARIVNTADYAYKIKTAQNGVMGSPWQILVNQPFKAATPGLVEALRQAAEVILKG